MAGDEDTGTLERTPTWAVATVFFVLISLSIFLEQLLHLLSKFFNKKKRRSLYQALDKIKSELMLLGLVSLFLTVSEKYIANICISKDLAQMFIPCDDIDSDAFDQDDAKCIGQGKASLLSREGVRQLQFLLFVLAFSHSLSCLIIFSLGMLKMKSWASWEAETKTFEYKFTNDPRRFQLAHQTSFGKRHLKSWSEHRLLCWPACFLRQFYESVSKTDYLTLRHGFIMAHFSEGREFDFRKYIRKTLEKDFKVVVGVSFWIWIFTVLFIFFNANEFYSYLWLPFIPLLMILVVGTKLQVIITQMCVDSHDKSHIVRGTLLVKPSDHFFWFNRPKFILHLIHFILFQNSFQVAFFTWTSYKYGLTSCFHRKTEDIAIRIILGVVVQVLCGYVTLPLYALVSQMGSSMKEAIFTEKVVHGLKRWRGRAKKKVALRNNFKYYYNISSRPSVDTSVSAGTSPSLTVEAWNSVDRDLPPREENGRVAVEIEEEKVLTR